MSSEGKVQGATAQHDQGRGCESPAVGAAPCSPLKAGTALLGECMELVYQLGLTTESQSGLGWMEGTLRIT